jgi:glycyl-tRNA synthetase beta chain
MAARADFLVEVGTEELPPKALKALSAAFAENFQRGLEEARLSFKVIERFASPRRLALRVTDMALAQPDEALEQRGPPLQVAFDNSGAPTRAALAFAERAGVSVDALERVTTDKGAWLVYRATLKGQAAAKLLPEITTHALAGLPIPKLMRWGAGDAEFVRPVHWLVMLLGSDVVPAVILGLQAGRATHGHRVHCPQPLELGHPNEYATRLERDGAVLADFDQRRERVQALTDEAATKLGGQAVYDDDLLDEVTALVECPVAMTGAFEPVYLELPEEVLVVTLQAHQRFFPVRGSDGSLLNRFIAMANLISTAPAQVQAGFERVVRPRLADAAFFFATDRRHSLEARREQLGKVLFQAKLGSLLDVTDRLGHLCGVLADSQGFDKAQLQRAAALSRSDLVTDMVGEFPELQGVMGMHYARHDGEDEDVARALAEQYRPRFAGDGLPTAPTGQCLALASRIDLITGIFSIGQPPSGTRDPFGLRRAALGLLRIAIECELDIDLPYLIRVAAQQLPVSPIPDALADQVYDYIVERLPGYYRERGEAVTPEMFQAVVSHRPVSPLDFDLRLKALAEFARHDAAQSLAAANKRVANILRKSEDALPDEVDPGLLSEPAEQRLFETLEGLRASVQAALRQRAYGAAMAELAATRSVIDEFFDDVMVNVEDRAVRLNRLRLLRSIRELYNGVGEISCLHVS